MAKNNNKIALIIDDEPTIHLYLTLVLKTKNVSVVGAETLEQAKQLLVQQKPEYIFIDNYLPDGMGIENIPQIREFSPNSTIIAMTSLYNTHWKNMALNNGANHFLEKPFSIHQIYSYIERSLNA